MTDKPVKHVLLTHYHAVRVLGASAYVGAEIIASDVTRAMIAERGQQDMDSEIGRFPRLFRGKDSIPGLTWPTLTFHRRMTLYLGSREVQIIHIGRSHTAGDTVAWLPRERVLFSGDVVEFGATPYCGDAHFTDWPATLAAAKALGAEKLVPGRGRSLLNRQECEEAIEGTRAFTSDLFAIAKRMSGAPLNECYAQAMDGDEAEIRALGHLRALHAVQRLPRLGRGARPRHPAHLDRRARRGDVARARARQRLMPHASPRYASVPGRGGHHPVVVVGGGLVGLTLALDLAQHGVAVVLLDDDDTRQHRQPGDLLRQAHAGDLRAARAGARACWRRA